MSVYVFSFELTLVCGKRTWDTFRMTYGLLLSPSPSTCKFSLDKWSKCWQSRLDKHHFRTSMVRVIATWDCYSLLTNLSAVLLSHPIFHARIKYIEFDIYFMRKWIIVKKMLIQCVPSTAQMVNILNKPLKTEAFHNLRIKFKVVAFISPWTCRRVLEKLKLNFSVYVSYVSVCIPYASIRTDIRIAVGTHVNVYKYCISPFCKYLTNECLY